MVMNIILAVIFVIEFSLALLFAWLRGFLRTTVKLGAAIVAGLLSFVLTLAAGGLFEGLAKLGAEIIAKLFSKVGLTANALTEVLPQLLTAALKPIAFAVIFFALKTLFDIIIFFVLLRHPNVKLFKGQIAVTFIAGALIGLLCFWVAMVPLGGTVRLISTAIPKTEKTEKIVSNALGLDSNFALGLTKILGGEKLYDELTKIKINNKETTLIEEAKPLAKLAESKINGFKDQNLSDLAESIANSETGKTIVSEELKKAVEKWKDGEKSEGIQILTGDKNKDELAQKLLEQIEESQPEKVDEVLDFLEDFKELEDDFSGEKFVELMKEAEENEAMKPFSNDMIKWYLHLAEKSLEVDATEEIEKISINDATAEETDKLFTNMKELTDAISGFEDRLIQTDGEITEEEYDVFRKSLEPLTKDEIIGGAVSKLISEYDKK